MSAGPMERGALGRVPSEAPTRVPYETPTWATETESVETLDAFADTLLELAAQVETDAGPLREAPVTAPVRRLDEARAARSLVARWHPPSEPDEAGSDPART